jgi:hypothetical protein
MDQDVKVTKGDEMKLFAVLIPLALLAAEKSDAPKPPVIKVEDKLQLKDLEATIYKERSDRSEYVKQSEQREQAALQQYTMLWQRAMAVCGDKFQLNQKLECELKPQAPPATK